MHAIMLGLLFLLEIFGNVKSQYLQGTSDGQDIQPRNHGTVYSFTNYPFVACLFNPGAGIYYGTGVAMNDAWLLFRASDAISINNQWSDIFVYIGIANPFALQTTDIQYTIKKVVLHPNYVATDISNDVAMVKVCPNIILSKYALIPPVGTVYTEGNKMTFFFYRTSKDKLYYDPHISILGDATCSIIPLFDTNEFYCAGTQTNNVGADAVDLDNGLFMLYQNTYFYGFVDGIDASDDDNVIYAVQKIDQLRAWIIGF